MGTLPPVPLWSLDGEGSYEPGVESSLLRSCFRGFSRRERECFRRRRVLALFLLILFEKASVGGPGSPVVVISCRWRLCFFREEITNRAISCLFSCDSASPCQAPHVKNAPQAESLAREIDSPQWVVLMPQASKRILELIDMPKDASRRGGKGGNRHYRQTVRPHVQPRSYRHALLLYFSSLGCNLHKQSSRTFL